MKTLRFFALPLLLVAALLVAGCGGGSKGVPSSAVARVGNDTITKAQFAALLLAAKASYKSKGTPFPKAGTASYKTLQDQIVSYLVQEAEFTQKGKDLGVTVTDKDVQARLAQIKTQYFGGSETKYKAQLKQQGLTEPELLDELRAQILSEKLYSKVTLHVIVTDKQLKAYCAKTPSACPPTRDVRHILVSNKALADKLETQLKNGASFAVLAKKYSKDTGSAASGGKLTVSRGQTVPPFDKVAFSIKTGQISAPVHSTYGWHIIQALSAVRPPVLATVRTTLLQTQKTTTMNNWVAAVKKSYLKKLAYQTGYAPAATGTTSTATATTTG